MALDSGKLRYAIESITDLPTLPVVVAKITGQIANPATNAADIGKLIEQDQALTSKVLKLVNSAYYGFPKQIKSIQHAVVILGFNKVKTLIITASVFGVFKGRKGGGLDMEAFWIHSLGTAITSKIVAEMIGIGHASEDAFVGGLLHDIGKVVLDQYQPALYNPIVRYVNDKGILLVEGEKETMGLTHAAVGEWMMERWRLPSAIVRMVADHHSPAAGSERRELIGAVHLGDILARGLGLGSGGDCRMPVIEPGVASAYEINKAFFDKAISRTIVEVERARDFFSLILDS